MKNVGKLIVVGWCTLLVAACGEDGSSADHFLEVTLEQLVSPAEDTVETSTPETTRVITSAISADESPFSTTEISDSDGSVTCIAYPISPDEDLLDLVDVEPRDAGTITLSSGSDSYEMGYDGETYNLPSFYVAVGYQLAGSGEGGEFHDEWSVDLAGGSDIEPASATATTPTAFGGEDVVVRHLDFERLNVTPATDEAYSIELLQFEQEAVRKVVCDDVSGTFEWSFDPETSRIEPVKVYRKSSEPLAIGSGEGTFDVVSSRGIAGSPPAEKWLSFDVSQTIQTDGARTFGVTSRSGQDLEEAPDLPQGCETIQLDDTLPDDPRIDAGDVTIAAGSIEFMLMTNEFEYYGERADLDAPVDEWTFTATGGADTSNSRDTIDFGEAPDSAQITVNEDSIEISWTGPERPYFEISVSDGFIGERLRCSGETSPYVWDRTVGETEDVSGWVGSKSVIEATSWDATDVVLVTNHRRIADVN